jgi:hypothetical protein
MSRQGMRDWELLSSTGIGCVKAHAARVDASFAAQYNAKHFESVPPLFA